MSEFPAILEALLKETPPSDRAWADFAREYTPLLIHVARSTSSGRDQAMDAYAALLEKLSDDHCRRLRAYSVNPKSKFTTWLVVVARRICIDYNRTCYGRLRSDDSVSERENLGVRRRLQDLTTTLESTDSIPDDTANGVVQAVEREELSAELKTMRDSLASSDRLLLTLRFDNDLSAAEIATLMRFPSQFHVYRRINTLLSEMRARLEARGYETAAS